MSTISGFVRDGRSRLVEAGVPPPEAAGDAEMLARAVLGWDRARYIAHGRGQAPSWFAARYRAALARRERREPVSLITGHREFWGLDFTVTSDVLTPRPETELLVEEAIRCLRRHPSVGPQVADVGTGSGCVAVAIASELPDVRITATDVSAAALTVARHNAIRHGVADRIRWLRTPLLEGLANDDTIFDLVVANLPYVPTSDIETLAAEVRDYEPRVALDGGKDGLETIRKLVNVARGRLTRHGHLVLEVGVGQATPLSRYLEDHPELVVRDTRPDLQGIPRVVTIQRSPES